MHTNTIKVNFWSYLTLQIDFNIYICVSKNNKRNGSSVYKNSSKDR